VDLDVTAAAGAVVGGVAAAVAAATIGAKNSHLACKS